MDYTEILFVVDITSGFVCPWWLIKRDIIKDNPDLFREGAPVFHTAQVSQLLVRAGGRAEMD